MTTALASDDDRLIHDLVRRFVDAWNRRDWPAFAACFSERADYVTGEAVRWPGRAAIQQGMQSLVATGGSGGQAIISQQTIRRLGDDIAIVHLSWRLAEENPATAVGARDGITLLVLAIHEGFWRIEAAQNTDAAPTTA
jgi:uncharacterized protein (TIGR02246 family)